MRALEVAAIGALCIAGALAAQTTATPAENGAPPQAVRRVARISSGVMQGQLLNKVEPAYPQIARDSRLQGMVTLHAIIDKDGHVEKVDAVAGPEMLRDAAVDAVKQWIYRPYLLNGEPTEVDTTVVVSFSLNPSSGGGGPMIQSGHSEGTGYPPPPGSQQRPIGPARIASGIMQGQLLGKVAPVYPPSAKKDGIQGTVVMHAIIGKNGHIDKLVVISGPDELRDAASDAVSQWTYRPYLLNGEPTEVDTTIIVNFNLNQPHK